MDAVSYGQDIADLIRRWLRVVSVAFRLLMALGQLLLYNDLAVELVKGLELDLKKFEAAGDKVREIARELSLILGGGGTSV